MTPPLLDPTTDTLARFGARALRVIGVFAFVFAVVFGIAAESWVHATTAVALGGLGLLQFIAATYLKRGVRSGIIPIAVGVTVLVAAWIAVAGELVGLAAVMVASVGLAAVAWWRMPPPPAVPVV